LVQQINLLSLINIDRKKNMFKKIMVSVVSAAIFMSGMPAQAGTFGSSKSSTSSASRTTAAPTVNRSPAARPASGGISRGGSIGMTRSDVSNRVRNGTNVAPANESSVAGKYPSAGNYNNGSSNYNYNDRRAQNNSNYNGYNNNTPAAQPNRGHSTGALIGAAAAGAVGGYMLNGMMHNRDGSLHNGAGYNNGVPVQGYNGNQNVAPQGYAPNQGMAYAAAPAQSGGGSFLWSLLALLLIASLIYFMWKTFFAGKQAFKPEGTNMFSGKSMFNDSPVAAPVETKSPEAELRDMKENFFANFQKNNKPSGMNFIQSNSEPMFFDAIRDTVLESSDTRTITIRSLEAKVVDITQDGSRFIGSVTYKGTVVEKEANYEPVVTDVNEMWNFVYTDGGWKLAGLEQL
jgi:hypothetical protein